MAALSAGFQGPIHRALWKRFRPRHLGAVVATGSVLVLLVSEPNLSGVWVEAGVPGWEVHHVGRSVQASLLDGTPSFTANFTDERRLAGRINLFWTEERMIAACGSGYPEVSEVVDFVAQIQPNFDSMDVTYIRSVHSDADCAFQRRERVTTKFTRREEK